MKKNGIIFLLGLVVALGSCKKNDNDEPGGGNTGESKYIISAVAPGSVGESSDYLLVTDNIASGTLTTVGSGAEQDGYREYVFNQNKVFSFVWGTNGVGPVTTYTLDGQAKLVKGQTVNVPTAQILGATGTEVYGVSGAWTGGEDNAASTIFRIDAASSTTPVVQRQEVELFDLAGNGEMADLYALTITGGKLFASYKTVDEYNGTSFKDSTWIAVFSYPGLAYEKTIKDNRTSYINYRSLYATEAGDVYGFSSADLETEGEAASTKPSAAIKIKTGTTEYDQTYFFNIQEASGGHHLNRAKYFGNNKFLLTMYAEAGSTDRGSAEKLAVVDVAAKTFTWVADAPTGNWDISYASYTEEDGKTILSPYIDGTIGTYIYSIDANTAKATRGVKLDGVTAVRGIGKLKTN